MKGTALRNRSGMKEYTRKRTCPGIHPEAVTGIIIFIFGLYAGSVLAESPAEEAERLYIEASRILRSASGAATDPKVYAQAVFKLERAQRLADKAAKNGSKRAEKLQEEINAALFWARKFSTLPMIREIEKGDPGKNPGGSKGPPPTSDGKKNGQRSPTAEDLFRKAEAYERSHKNDDHAVALRWFQVADRTAGTEWSLRALSRAQEAQARYKASQEEKDETEPLTEDARLIHEGNKFLRMEKYPQALDKFKAAQKIRNSLRVQQRIGHTFLEMGYEVRDEYARQYLPLVKQYNAAARRGDRRTLVYLRRKAAALVKRLRPLEQKAIQHYKSAENAFRNGLKMAEGRDLDCEAHLAILEFQRKKRKNARRQLGTVLRKYKPGNDEERTVFEYCKSLLKYIKR